MALLLVSFMEFPSFNKAETGILGLHASQVADAKWNRSHIFIGGGGKGKTTYAQLLEDLYPNRFKAIADDWVEIDTKLNGVRPVSKSISVRPGALAESMLNSMQNEPGQSFKSFGKDFYIPKPPQKPPEEIGKIFQLHSQPIDDSDQGLILLFRSFNYHIPFLSQMQFDSNLLPPNVCSKIDALCKSYIKVVRQSNFHFINVQKDLNPVLAEIVDELN